jgi:hypothetical protein
MKTANEVFEAWKNQAACAIDQGQSINDFLCRCHPANRRKARQAWNEAQKARLVSNEG